MGIWHICCSLLPCGFQLSEGLTFSQSFLYTAICHQLRRIKEGSDARQSAVYIYLTSKRLPTLVKSQPSTWAICGSITSLSDIKRRLNTNHRLETFCLQYLPFPCCHKSPIDFESTNISRWWELTSFSCLFTHSVQSKKPVALFTLVYK